MSSTSPRKRKSPPTDSNGSSKKKPRSPADSDEKFGAADEAEGNKNPFLKIDKNGVVWFYACGSKPNEGKRLEVGTAVSWTFRSEIDGTKYTLVTDNRGMVTEVYHQVSFQEKERIEDPFADRFFMTL